MILLVSGGLDSFIAWHLLGKPRALYVKGGQRYQDMELAALDKISSRSGLKPEVTDRVRFGDLEQPDGYIPLRNMYLVMAALEFDTVVALAAVRGENSADKDRRFARASSGLLGHCLGVPVSVLRPVAHFTKTGLVAEYMRRVGDPLALKLTVSCYNGGYCGKCQSCFRRWVAMTLNGLPEVYAVDPRRFAREQVWAGLRKHGWRGVWRTLPANIEALRALGATR